MFFYTGLRDSGIRNVWKGAEVFLGRDSPAITNTARGLRRKAGIRAVGFRLELSSL
jgi:hypothetical protein